MSRLAKESIVVAAILVSASAALAEEPEVTGTPEQEAEDKYPRLIKPEGDREDNAQRGGEPSLTEVKEGPAAHVDGEHDADAPRDDCDLDCLEAREQKGRREGATQERDSEDR